MHHLVEWRMVVGLVGFCTLSLPGVSLSGPESGKALPRRRR